MSKSISIKANATITDVTVDGLVDGTNLTDLNNRAWSKTKEQILQGQYNITKNVTIVADVNVTGKINGISVDSLMTTNTEQTILGLKSFANNVSVLNNVTLKNFTLNSFDIPKDVVTTHSTQSITGVKKFKDDVVLQVLESDGLIDGVNVTDFNTYKMTLTTTQEIPTNMTFNSGFMTTSDITVGGLVDGVNLTALNEDLMMAGKTQVITG